MTKHFHNVLLGISVLPALLVMPAFADGEITYPYTIAAGDTYTAVAGYSNAESGVFKNNGTLTISDNLEFLNNSTNLYGGTIYAYNVNATHTTVGNNVTFSGSAMEGTGSYGGMGGVIYTWSDGTAEGANVFEFGDNVTFRDSEALDGGGAIYTYGYNTLTAGDNVTFENNFSAYGSGGIVLNGYDAFHGKDFVNTFTAGKNARFINNSTLFNGGAAYIGGDANDRITLGDGAVFSGNSAAVGGAAAGFGTFDFDDVTFTSNIAFNAYGHFFQDWGWGTGYSSYDGRGGALYSAGDLIINGDALFADNAAENLGGALYNRGTATFNGDITFTNNKQMVTAEFVEDDDAFSGAVLTGFSGGQANDIYNIGTLNIVGGTTTVDGGIDGTGDLNIASGATLNIGTTTLTENEINLDGTLIATVKPGAPQLNAATFTGNGTLKLAVHHAGTHTVFGDAIFENTNGIVLESAVYDLVLNGADVIATQKSIEDIATDNHLTEEVATAVSGMAASTSSTLNDLAVIIQEKLATGDVEDKAVVEEITNAIHPETQSVVQSMTSNVQTTITNLAVSRMMTPVAVGHSGGDVAMTSGGVWVQGIFNKSKQSDSFDGYTRGIAAGMDGTLDKVFTVGAGYSYTHSDINGTLRDTEIDNLTAFAYAQYKPTSWFMNGVASYTMSAYSETGDVYGTPVTADYNVDSFGAHVSTGYTFQDGMTPEIAVRYMHINGAEYTNSLGIQNKLEKSDYLTASVGTKYAFDVKPTKNLSIRPELQYSFKYDVLSDKQIINVTMPGIDTYVLNGERLSRLSGEFGIGLGIEYRGLNLSANYDVETRDRYTSQTGRLKFRYNF
ncbi:MAG: autotransporter domain-containing protein [Alphaproteobacteria bacterium]|nr:autotransporter domain-containing protein [Alphaproteobacteria bacterium]